RPFFLSAAAVAVAVGIGVATMVVPRPSASTPSAAAPPTAAPADRKVAPVALPAPAPEVAGEPSLDLASLPAATDEGASTPSAPADGQNAKAPAAPPPTARSTAAVTAKGEPVAVAAELTLTEHPASPAGGADGLGAAMRSAVGPGNLAPPAPSAAEDRSAAARQLRPSQGALSGALHAVLPSARACLGPDDAIRSGAITFRSDGTVARIDLRGERPSDGCV